MKYYTWSRYNGYECSSKGDGRFSAFYAKLKDGRSIEEHWQVDCKGYPTIKAGKGNRSLNKMINPFAVYKELWLEFFSMEENKNLLEQLKLLVHSRGNCFSDMFATTEVNQARAIATILNDQILDKRKYHYHEDRARPQKSIFVFGSNLSGVHGAGAALLAADSYGAVIGEAEGLQDCSYAIPTVNYYVRGAARQERLPLKEIKQSVAVFKQVAGSMSTGKAPTRFFVTRIGCVLAGYEDKDIAPMFRNSPTNCSFAEQWMAYLE